ncbi:MAG: PEGA domain-containing protein [Candidatus Acidiferrales bacterium]
MKRILPACLFLTLFAGSLSITSASAGTLRITSTPSGATVEINGITVGTTPYETNYPGGYFHKPHSAFSARLKHEMVLRISKRGFATQRITLSDGPFVWKGLNGRRRGNYWLLKQASFDVALESLSTGDADSFEEEEGAGPIYPRNPPEQHAQATPATPAAESGDATITSDSPGADIYVDGQFVGQTPSTISLASGVHHLTVKASGKKEWSRDLEVLPGSKISLHPVLEQQP